MSGKRILIGCEFGDNRGHIARCIGMAEALRALDVTVVLVLPIRFARSLPKDLSVAVELMSDWNATESAGHSYGSGQTRSMGDVLVQLGFRIPERVETAVKNWSALLLKHRPAAVIADYAPNLLSAARGRIPTISIGTGFTCPPTSIQHFKTLIGKTSAYDEDATLGSVNDALRLVNRPSLESLPGLFASDVEVVGTFRELDPYAKQRWTHPYASPSVSSVLPETIGPQGHEIFVYSYNGVSPDSAFWMALTAPGHPVRLYMDKPDVRHISVFAKHGIRLEPRPIGFDLVARRSRMVVSHGGHGIVASSMLSGLPIVMACFDMEKYLNGAAAERTKVGKVLWANGSKAILMAEAIDTIWSEPKHAQAAIRLAETLKQRQQPTMAQRVLAAATSMIA